MAWTFHDQHAANITMEISVIVNGQDVSLQEILL